MTSERQCNEDGTRAEKRLLGAGSEHESSDMDSSEDLELDELNDADDEVSISSLDNAPKPRWMSWSAYKQKRLGSASSRLAWTKPRRRRPPRIRLCRLLSILPLAIAGLIVFCGVFFPSYSSPPARYYDLRRRVLDNPGVSGSANANNEKVFVVASIYDPDGKLLSGDWGKAVSDLIEILGPENVYLSIYENDPNPGAEEALNHFADCITCNSSLVTEHLDFSELHHVEAPDGTQKLKRMAFLAEVRNRALKPLNDSASPASKVRFDKILYLNDVIFDPIEAANLLFSTNTDATTGKTDYRAACAVDFINPFKFYDTFASRDMEGYRMGVPFYPWFTGTGDGVTRRDVLSQTDAVRVKSCWGGMVAYEAHWFQPWMHDAAEATSTPSKNTTEALKFRSESDIYWDASECCLINADLTAMASDELAEGETGIYMNPYIRVAYSKNVLIWLPFTKRFERLYTPIHSMVNWIGDRPSYNPRRLQEPGDVVIDRVWEWDDEAKEALKNHDNVGKLDQGLLHGSYKAVSRVATPGQFCGHRKLAYINEHPDEGEKNWASFEAPAEKR